MLDIGLIGIFITLYIESLYDPEIIFMQGHGLIELMKSGETKKGREEQIVLKRYNIWL